MALFYIFAKVFNIGFNKNNWILPYASAFIVLHNVTLTEACEGSPASYRHVVGGNAVF